MTLEIELGWHCDNFQLEVSFATASSVIAVFGPSGAGKTTLVKLIAGLLKPAWGRVVLDGYVLFDHASGRDVPIHRRRIGCVFQEHRLFPHLNVRRNLLYGYRSGTPNVEAIIALLGLGELLRRYPQELSGGERQRVALARAFLANPQMMLMDEPLASLDAARRSEIIPYIDHLHHTTNIPIIYVTHDLEEVARLAQTLVVIHRGRLIAAGNLIEVATTLGVHEVLDPFVSILEGCVETQWDDFALTELSCSGQRLLVPKLPLLPGTAVRITIPARQVVLSTSPVPVSSNSLAGRIVAIQHRGSTFTLVRLDIGNHELVACVTRRSAEQLRLAIGKPSLALVNAVRVFELARRS